MWVGCDYPKKVDDLAGNTYPGRIWQTYMEQIHEGLPLMEFADYVEPKKDETDEEDDVQYNAFGEPIDPETGLPYGTVIDPESGVLYVPEDSDPEMEPVEGDALPEAGKEENAENDAVNDGTEGVASEIDQSDDTVYDTEDGLVNDAGLLPTPTPDPRDAWFDSMYNQQSD